MRSWTRRDVLKTGIAASVGAAIPAGLAGSSSGRDANAAADTSSGPGVAPAPSPRERLLLDFNWRFHLGHADDATRDFGFGTGEAFGKTQPSAVKLQQLAQLPGSSLALSIWRLVM